MVNCICASSAVLRALQGKTIINWNKCKSIIQHGWTVYCREGIFGFVFKSYFIFYLKTCISRRIRIGVKIGLYQNLTVIFLENRVIAIKYFCGKENPFSWI